MKTVGVIPMKKRSTRFPGKNYRSISAVPMLMTALEKLISACDMTYVLTDDPDTADALMVSLCDCCKERVKVVVRPESTCVDGFEGGDVAHWFAKEVLPDEDVIIIYSQLTTPLWDIWHLPHMLNHVIYKDINSMVSVNPAFQPNGALYINRRRVLLAEKQVINSQSHLYVMNWRSSFDIDYPHQLCIAEALYAGDYIMAPDHDR